jgi:histone H3/H4
MPRVRQEKPVKPSEPRKVAGVKKMIEKKEPIITETDEPTTPLDKKKKRRRKRGALTKRNIIKHQKGNTRVMQEAPFKALLRKLLNDLGHPKTGLRHGVVKMFMDYAEFRYINVLQVGDKLSKFAGRVQLKERDLQFAYQLEARTRKNFILSS